LKVKRRFDPVLEESGCPILFKESRRAESLSHHSQARQSERTRTGQLPGQGLLPMVDLIEQCQVACDQLIDMTGRTAIQAV
jgi:hypothetical protein